MGRKKTLLRDRSPCQDKEKAEKRKVARVMAQLADVLTGPDEGRRNAALRTLLMQEHDPTLHAVATRVVQQLLKGSEEVRLRAQYCLQQLGWWALPALLNAMAVPVPAAPRVQLIETLRSAAADLPRERKMTVWLALLRLSNNFGKPEVAAAASTALTQIFGEEEPRGPEETSATT